MRYQGALAAVLLAAGTALAADSFLVEDWGKQRLGARGVPADWKTQNWGSPRYDFTVVDNDGHRVLQLRSKDDSSIITRDLRGAFDLKETPIIEWSWKVTVLPKGAFACKGATDDMAAQLYVAWPRFPEAVRTRAIGYIWDTTAPVGTVCKSEKTGTVTYIVVESGPANLGRWVTERRNVAEDFRRVYGEAPENPGLISLGIDSNDVHGEAESFMGPILFRRP